MSCSGNCGNCTIGCVSGCNVTCLYAQNFCGGHCSGESQSASHYFSFTHGTLSRDTIIKKGFPPSTLNSWGSYVQSAAQKGATQDSFGWSWKGAETPFLHGSDIMELIAGMKSLQSGSNPGVSVSRDSIVYGNDLQTIQTALDNLKLYYWACDKCNTACDNPGSSKCNTCQNCLTCNNQSSWSSSY